ncbi:PadR family transcriptional regulator [candidate division KSB1 bacterium]
MMNTLTVLEQTVLIAIFKLGNEAYSVTIHRKILEITGADMIIGSLYNVLDQLYKKGRLLKSRGEPLSEKGGKSRMYYSISEEGLKALEETKRFHNTLWDGMPEVLYE